MNNKFRVSIIIPIFIVEDFIQQCLQSVAAQTMTEGVECIIVDDCGKDRSLALAKQFCEDYTGNIHFKIICRDKNGGLSAARNSGIRQAQGKYIYFLDSDDEITPNCIELMYSKIDKYGDVDLVQGSFYETEEEKRTMSAYNLPEYTDNRKLIKSFLLRYEGDIVGAQSRLIRKDFLHQHHLFFKEDIIHEDNYWTFFLAKHVGTMVFCPQRTYFHRHNPKSITKLTNIANETKAYKTIIEDCTANIDAFLPGLQKELILNTLITAINSHYYETTKDKDTLIHTFAKCNTSIEKKLLKSFFRMKDGFLKTKLLHLLIRLYKS